MTAGMISLAPDYAALCEQVAARIATLVRAEPDTVLGLATGATPLGVYRALVRLHREEGLDFSKVTCFNLDEYYPMPPEAPYSYHTFMQAHLFGHINCRRWHVPSGRLRDSHAVAADCRHYEDAIRDAGGIALQLLGVGRSGHIGFNEPGSLRRSRTRLVDLDPRTRQDAAAGFGGIGYVPVQAVTMGIGTILEAREIALMAPGATKAGIIQEALAGGANEDLPVSLAFLHPNLRLYLDRPILGGSQRGNDASDHRGNFR